MKWTNNNVTYDRGIYKPIAFKFDNSSRWLTPDCICSTQTARAEIRRIGKAYGANSVVVRYFSDVIEEIPVEFFRYDGEYTFRNEIKVPSGELRRFINYVETDIFPNGKY